MKQDKSDIRLLLSILLLVSLSIGMLYAVEPQDAPGAVQAPDPNANPSAGVPTATPKPLEFQIVGIPKPPEAREVQAGTKDHPFANLTPQKINQLLYVYQAAEDVDKMAEVLKGLTAQKTVDIAKVVIDDKNSPLNRNDKLEFLYALTANYPNDSSARYMILDLIIDRSSLLDGPALLLVAARSEFAHMIPSIIAWAKNVVATKGEARTPREIALLVQESLEQAVNANEPQSLEKLFSNGTPITKDYASRLAWLVVEGKKKLDFIKLLVANGADVNYPNKGYSLIGKATEMRNEPMVHAIIDAAGKNLEINALHDPEIGTALQIAIQKGFASIDEYLRENGANEDSPLITTKNKKNQKVKAKGAQ